MTGLSRSRLFLVDGDHEVFLASVIPTKFPTAHITNTTSTKTANTNQLRANLHYYTTMFIETQLMQSYSISFAEATTLRVAAQQTLGLSHQDGHDNPHHHERDDRRILQEAKRIHRRRIQAKNTIFAGKSRRKRNSVAPLMV